MRELKLFGKGEESFTKKLPTKLFEGKIWVDDMIIENCLMSVHKTSHSRSIGWLHNMFRGLDLY